MKRYLWYILFVFVYTNCFSQTSSFRFAELTDIHVSPVNPSPREDLMNSVSQLNKNDSIDFIIVAGDITEEGDRASMMKVKSILDQLNKPYYIIPGNHETKWSESGCTDFSSVFGNERFCFKHKGSCFIGFNSGPQIRMAEGHVTAADIEWIKNEVSANSALPTFIITHYPMRKNDVDNWYSVLNILPNYNIRAFIGGHYHRNIMTEYNGIPAILGRSNLKDKDGKAGYTIFHVNADSLVAYEHRYEEAPHKWATLLFNEKAANKLNNEIEIPGLSINNEYGQVNERWIKNAGGAIYSSAIIDGKRILTGDERGILSCRSLKKGKLLWEFKANNKIFGMPAAYKNIVVFGAADSCIYGVDSKRGSLKWRIKANKAVLGATIIDKGIAYIGASDNCMRAININTGEMKWNYNKVKGYIETRPLLTDDKIIFGAWDNTLYCLNRETGKEIWKWNGSLTRMHFSPAAVWPVATKECVFITDPQRAITCIDINNGKTIWRTYQSMVRETIGLSTDKERIYCKTMNDSIVCYSTSSKEPVKLWSTNAGFGYEHASTMIVERDNVIYATTKNGLIIALDGKTGKILWKHKVGNSLINTVTPIDDNNMLITSTDGSIALLYANNKITVNNKFKN